LIINTYKTLGGQHPETNVLKNILAYIGIKAPHTGQSFSEAMLLGIGGGLGMAYILWEFKEHENAELVLAFRNNFQYPIKFLNNLSDRIGITPNIYETGGKKKAVNDLLDALQNQTPVMSWVELLSLPYMFPPGAWTSYWGHIVGIFGFDETENIGYIDDRSEVPFIITASDLATARGKIPSFKNRLMTFEADGEIVLENAIWTSIMSIVD
jgi:hypothetical protein